MRIPFLERSREWRERIQKGKKVFLVAMLINYP